MKEYKLVIDFLKDRIGVICIMLINTLFISIFYKVTLKGKVEIFYPIIITLFFLCILLIIEFVKYFPFNSDLETLKSGDNTNLRIKTTEQERSFMGFRMQKEKWIQENEALKMSYEEKQSFLISAIHKLKNNIGVINVILEKIASIDIKEIKILEEEAQEIGSMLDNTLNFVRLGAFYEDFEIVKIDIVQEVREVINNRKNGFITREIFPNISCSEESLYVLTDKKWNRIILEQLISNALKYSKIESKEVLFSIKKEGHNKVSLSIEDSGIGIPDYDIDRVFNPFFTGENGRKNRNSTGIGLFIAKNICKSLDQSIEIKSIVNKGTKVKVSYLSKA